MARWVQVALHTAKQQTKHGQPVSVPSFAALLRRDAVAHAIARQSRHNYGPTIPEPTPLPFFNVDTNDPNDIDINGAYLLASNQTNSNNPNKHVTRSIATRHPPPPQQHTPPGTTATEPATWLYVHIPKTGGTSIEAAAKAHGFKWGRHDSRFKRSQHSNASVGQYPPPKKKLKLLRYILVNCARFERQERRVSQHPSLRAC